MIKKDFIKLYAKKNSLDEKVAEDEIERVLDTIKFALSQEKTLVFRKFGSFEVRETKERMIVDPKDSNNKIKATPRKYVKFKVSRKIEDSLVDIDK